MSPNFLTIGEHHVIELGQPPWPSLFFIRSVDNGCVSPSNPDSTCACPQRGAVTLPPKALLFLCKSENNNKMKEWLLQQYGVSTFNTCPHRALHCMVGPHIEIHVNPTAKPVQGCKKSIVTDIQFQYSFLFCHRIHQNLYFFIRESNVLFLLLFLAFILIFFIQFFF